MGAACSVASSYRQNACSGRQLPWVYHHASALRVRRTRQSHCHAGITGARINIIRACGSVTLPITLRLQLDPPIAPNNAPLPTQVKLNPLRYVMRVTKGFEDVRLEDRKLSSRRQAGLLENAVRQSCLCAANRDLRVLTGCNAVCIRTAIRRSSP
jgi:hypothetical protein